MTNPVKLEIMIPSNTADGLNAQEKLVALMEQFEYSMRDVFAMRLSLEEGITNAIRHGNKFATDKNVIIRCDISTEKMRVVIVDEGEGFDPEDVPDPTLEEFIERPLWPRPDVDACLSEYLRIFRRRPMHHDGTRAK
jgi:serine/threonine-protein kinase RsbW